MSYTQSVSDFAKTDQSVKLHLFAGLLCCLLMIFAVAAKVAPYHPHQQAAKSFTGNKILENDEICLPDPGRITPQTPFLLNFVCLLLSAGLFAAWQVLKDEPVLPALFWFSPYLSVRPPPTL